MNFNCENCGWAEIVGSSIMCHYNGGRTWRDECCEAWKTNEEETNIVEVVRCKDCKWFSEKGFCKHPDGGAGNIQQVIKKLEEISDYFFSVYHHSEDREEINNAKDRCDAVEDAIALLKKQDNCENCAIAIEDRQPVVRCKDCKNAEILTWLDNAIICNKHSYRGLRPDEFYCADGERR